MLISLASDWAPGYGRAWGAPKPLSPLHEHKGRCTDASHRVIAANLYIGGKWHVNEQLLQGAGAQESLLPPNENAA